MIKGVQHVNVTISNLDEAIHFFCDILGFEMIMPVNESSSEGLRNITQLPDAHIKFCLVKAPDNTEIEITQYVEPKGERIDLKVCNIGVGHIAFEVDDIMKTYQELSAKGVVFTHPPVIILGGLFKGKGACYMKGPDGITIELIAFPKKA